MTPSPAGLRKLGALVLVAIALFAVACGPNAKHRLEAIVRPDGPVVESVEGSSGRHGGEPSGGDDVVVRGKNFPAQNCVVRFGKKSQTEFARLTPTEIALKVPDGLPPGETLSVSVEKRDDDDKVVARGVLEGAWTVSGMSIRGVILAGCAIGLFSLLGGPIFVVLASITLLGLYYENQGTSGFGIITAQGNEGETVGVAGLLFEDLFDKISQSPLFIAIPLFTFAGTIMAESKTPQRLVDFARALFGWLPGGVALVALITCSFFTAFTGASGVTIIALGGLLFPVLRKDRYEERFALGLLTTCGSLGLLFKPALPVYIYGIIAHVDADRVFTAALVPGVLLVVVLFIYSALQARRTGVQRAPFSMAELRRAFRAAAWELPIVPIVLGGMYSGWFTAAEASAVTATYAFIAQVGIYRDIKRHDLPRVVKTSMVLVGAIIMILGIALGFMGWLTIEQVPQAILDLMQQHVHSRHMFLAMLNVFLLIVGCVMEGYTATLVVVPLIAPIALKYGIDPYHLAVIFLLNLEIAYSLPPVGFNLFLSALRFGKPVVSLYRAALDFVLVMIVVLAIVTYWPPASLCLFQVPSIQIRGPLELDLKAGEEKKIQISVALGGVDLETARARDKEADDALAAVEKAENAVWADLERQRARLEDDELLKVQGEERARKLLELEGVRAKIKPFRAVVARKKETERLVTEVRSLGDSAEWRSSIDPDVQQKGLVFSTADLKPGEHEISVTAVDVHAHVTQEKLILRVNAAETKKD